MVIQFRNFLRYINVNPKNANPEKYCDKEFYLFTFTPILILEDILHQWEAVIKSSTGSQSEGVVLLTVSISVFFVVWQISSDIISISTSCKIFGRDPSAILPQPAIQQTVPKFSSWFWVKFHFRKLKMYHYRDRDESSTSYLDCVTSNHLKGKT